jgi:hypothetical protein
LEREGPKADVERWRDAGLLDCLVFVWDNFVAGFGLVNVGIIVGTLTVKTGSTISVTDMLG